MKVTGSAQDVQIATGKAVCVVIGTASRAPAPMQVIVACSDTANDSTSTFCLRHFTAAPTGGASRTPGPNNRNLGGPSCTFLSAGTGFTAEPSYDTYDPIIIPLNQRGIFAWYAPNYGDYLAKLGTTNGWAVECLNAASALKYCVTLVWDE